jgi:hypothetical protein
MLPKTVYLSNDLYDMNPEDLRRYVETRLRNPYDTGPELSGDEEPEDFILIAWENNTTPPFRNKLHYVTLKNMATDVVNIMGDCVQPDYTDRLLTVVERLELNTAFPFVFGYCTHPCAGSIRGKTPSKVPPDLLSHALQALAQLQQANHRGDLGSFWYDRYMDDDWKSHAPLLFTGLWSSDLQYTAMALPRLFATVKSPAEADRAVGSVMGEIEVVPDAGDDFIEGLATLGRIECQDLIDTANETLPASSCQLEWLTRQVGIADDY